MARNIGIARILTRVGCLSLDDAARQLIGYSFNKFTKSYGHIEDFQIERPRLKVPTYRILCTDDYIPSRDVIALRKPLITNALRVSEKLKQQFVRDYPVERGSLRPLEYSYEEMEESKRNIITVDDALMMLDTDQAEKCGLDLLKMHLILTQPHLFYFTRNTFGE